VTVDRPLADAGVLGDLGEAQVFQRAGLELVSDGAQDLLAGLLALAFAEIGRGVFHDRRTVMSSPVKSTDARLQPIRRSRGPAAPNRRADARPMIPQQALPLEPAYMCG
jgi:hypothetical protein